MGEKTYILQLGKSSCLSSINGIFLLQDGAPKIAKLPEKSGLTMVYGRYNELVNGVYKPTQITGHHPVALYRVYPYNTSQVCIGHTIRRFVNVGI